MQTFALMYSMHVQFQTFCIVLNDGFLNDKNKMGEEKTGLVFDGRKSVLGRALGQLDPPETQHLYHDENIRRHCVSE